MTTPQLFTAALAFAALFLFGAPFPLVVALAALYGWAATDPGVAASTTAPTAGQAPTLPRHMSVTGG